MRGLSFQAKARGKKNPQKGFAEPEGGGKGPYLQKFRSGSVVEKGCKKSSKDGRRGKILRILREMRGRGKLFSLKGRESSGDHEGDLPN